MQCFGHALGAYKKGCPDLQAQARGYHGPGCPEEEERKREREQGGNREGRRERERERGRNRGASKRGTKPEEKKEGG